MSDDRTRLPLEDVLAFVRTATSEAREGIVMAAMEAETKGVRHHDVARQARALDEARVRVGILWRDLRRARRDHAARQSR